MVHFPFNLQAHLNECCRNTNAAAGLSQIQVGSGLWSRAPRRSDAHTATGILELCRFTNVNLSGRNRIDCQGNSGPK